VRAEWQAWVVPADPALPTAEELAALAHEELAARLADAYRVRGVGDVPDQLGRGGLRLYLYIRN
jgi:hypothetical protein